MHCFSDKPQGTFLQQQRCDPAHILTICQVFTKCDLLCSICAHQHGGGVCLHQIKPLMQVAYHGFIEFVIQSVISAAAVKQFFSGGCRICLFLMIFQKAA